jgi:NAD(P)-dependent dehydrogenase (short-subunit alcohol dehydrogenase family)
MIAQRRIALVTGANRGLGYAVTAGLARRGLTVFLGAREPTDGEESAERLRAEGLDVRAVQLDVTDPQSIRRAVAHLEQDAGRLDVLVNNAGIAGDREVQIPGAVDLTAIREVFETNVFGVIAVTESMLPLLRRSSQSRVVNVSSSVGSLSLMSDPSDYFATLPGWLGYPPSKTALNQITVQYAKQASSSTPPTPAPWRPPQPQSPAACLAPRPRGRRSSLTSPPTATPRRGATAALPATYPGKRSGGLDNGMSSK